MPCLVCENIKNVNCPCNDKNDEKEKKKKKKTMKEIFIM
jgi:hypothetical protein